MFRRIRVLIVDDHLMVRKGLKLMLEEGEDIELVGDAVNGARAVELAQQIQPDVVVMDIRMPEMDGIVTMKHIRAANPQIAVILLTTYDEDELIIRGLQMGACGYLMKDTPSENLLNAIRTAARGELLVQPEIMARLLSHTKTLSPSGHFSSSMQLTKREREVLSGVARGERSKEIALHLGITERTVRAYLTTIYTKLNVDSRSSAVAVAITNGLLS